MRRTLITNLQWWLLVVLLTAAFAVYPEVVDADWWWSWVFYAAFYIGLILILRITWESRVQAAARRERARQIRFLRKPLGRKPSPWEVHLFVDSLDKPRPKR